MIVSRAPLRVSLFGGGSDLPGYSNKNIGAVLNFTINKYVYIAIHRNFQNVIQLKYSQSETVSNPEKIVHPIFRETFLMLGMKDAVEIGSFADVPASGSGLGSSSAFTAALIKAIRQFQNIEISSAEVAQIACEIEINRCKDPIGRQDQWASANGGINIFEFYKDKVTKIPLDISAQGMENFSERFLLFYIGGTRNSHQILREQNNLLTQNSATFRRMAKMVELVYESRTLIVNADYDQLGILLDEAWKLKRAISSGISDSKIDSIYEKAKLNGAIGGKLLGAGGAGFMIFIPKKGYEQQLISALKDYRHVPFEIDKFGAKIVYSEGESA